jgi:hypothetical protein
MDGLEDQQKILEQEDLKRQYLQQIEQLKQNYFENTEKMGQDNQAIQAFVLFRSMEGVERCIKAFDYNWFEVAWFSVFSCCMS